MKFYYEPHRIHIWNRDNQHLGSSTNEVPYNARSINLIEEMKTHYFSINDKEGKKAYLEGLSRRERVLSPHLYQSEQDEEIKEVLLEYLKKNAVQDKRIFNHVLEVFYDNPYDNNLWNITRLAYAKNKEKVERRLTKDQQEQFRNFLTSKMPLDYLKEKVLESGDEYENFMGLFFCYSSYNAYRIVAIKAMADCNETFIQKNEELFNNLFLPASSIERQIMASGIIKNCTLSNIRAVSLTIYQQMGLPSRKPTRWDKIDSSTKTKFSSWILSMEMKEFFKGVNQNHERFIYWKKFIIHMQDAIIIDKKKTILMYFEDVVVMEILGTGAVYIYEKNVFERNFQEKVDKVLNEREKYQNHPYHEPRDLKRDQVRDQEKVFNYDTNKREGRLIHGSSWQKEFDRWLSRNLQWEVNEHELTQKAKELGAEI